MSVLLGNTSAPKFGDSPLAPILSKVLPFCFRPIYCPKHQPFFCSSSILSDVAAPGPPSCPTLCRVPPGKCGDFGGSNFYKSGCRPGRTGKLRRTPSFPPRGFPFFLQDRLPPPFTMLRLAWRGPSVPDPFFRSSYIGVHLVDL